MRAYIRKGMLVAGILCCVMVPVRGHAADDPGDQPREALAADAAQTPAVVDQGSEGEGLAYAAETADGEVDPAAVPEQSADIRVTIDFKDADINNVLRVLSYKSGVNIVAGNDVQALVTIRLVDVPWKTALDVILSAYGYGYEEKGNIIMVSPLEKLTEQKKAEQQLADVQPLATEVFYLNFIDANDARIVIESQLSPRGRVTVLSVRGLKGWSFGGGQGDANKRERVSGADESQRSKILIVSDIPPSLEGIRKVIARLDGMPKQVLIEAKLMEVNEDALKDIGFDWGTGASGAESSTLSFFDVGRDSNDKKQYSLAGKGLSNQVGPSIFDAAASSVSATFPYNTGLSLAMRKLTGVELEALFHALEESVGTNTLSSPSIMVLNNQEATILVGTKYPILEANVSGTDSTTITSTLDYYQDIGIQLNVVPQISGEDFVNMIVHPAVSSYTETAKAKTAGDVTVAEYPIIEVREAETQVLMKSGETIVIGGLIKDVDSKGEFKIPLLGDLPVLGKLFRRDTVDKKKVDLLIFLTARIIDPETDSNIAATAPDTNAARAAYEKKHAELLRNVGQGQ